MEAHHGGRLLPNWPALAPIKVNFLRHRSFMNIFQHIEWTHHASLGNFLVGFRGFKR